MFPAFILAHGDIGAFGGSTWLSLLLSIVAGYELVQLIYCLWRLGHSWVDVPLWSACVRTALHAQLVFKGGTLFPARFHTLSAWADVQGLLVLKRRRVDQALARHDERSSGPPLRRRVLLGG